MRRIITLLLLSALAFGKTPEETLAGMTLPEKIGQMILVYHSPLKFLKKHHIGGVLIMQNMINEDLAIRGELAEIQKNLKVPLLVCIDQEGGKINRLANLEKYAALPSACKLAELEDSVITEKIAGITRFLNGLGINTNLAPCVDPALDYKGDTTFMLIRRRAFGHDPETITAKAGAFIDGIKKGKGLSILKHFPGYGVHNNSDEHITVSDVSDGGLEQYLLPFRALCKKADGIMMSNIVYRNIDSLPAVLSPKIAGLAREICGENLLITDDLWAVSLRSFVHPGKPIHQTRYPDARFSRITELAVRAGNDMLMITYPKKVPLMIRTIRQMAKKDPEIKQKIDESVLRILKTKARIGTGPE